MKSDSYVGGVLGLLVLAFMAACAYGWIANIIKLAGSDFAVITGTLVVRTLGIFLPPIGIIAGYIG